MQTKTNDGVMGRKMCTLTVNGRRFSLTLPIGIQASGLKSITTQPNKVMQPFLLDKDYCQYHTSDKMRKTKEGIQCACHSKWTNVSMISYWLHMSDISKHSEILAKKKTHTGRRKLEEKKFHSIKNEKC